MPSTERGTDRSSDFANRFVLLLTIIILSVAGWRGGGAVALPAMILLLPCAIGFGSVYTVHLALIFAASYIVFQFIPASTPLILAKSGGIALYFYMVALIPLLRRSLDWFRAGRLSYRAGILLGGIVIGSALALILLAHSGRQDPTAYERLLPPSVSPRWIPLYMVTFAALNALIEEIIWRGVMLTALEAAFGAGLVALLFQAMHFGFAHYRSAFPDGWSGVALTTLFGIVLGLLRRRTNGLLAPWCAHVAADMVIMCMALQARG